MRSILLAAGLGLAAASPVMAQPAAAPPPAREAWAALRDAKFALPAGTRAVDALREMNALVASADPFLRDNVAYEAAAHWIYAKPALTPDEQRAIMRMWLANLQDGVGEVAGDRVFRRSFSALNLSVIAARDNAAPFLSQAEFDAFLDATLDYLARERDMRGYDAAKGWIHTAAHTADVLKFLARSGKLQAPAQARVIAAIDAKCASAGVVFAWGEDERLAQVIASLARRADFDRAAFAAWLARIIERRAALWAAAPAIDPAKFPEVQNLKMLLRAAYVALSLDVDQAPVHETAASILSALKALR